MLSETGVLEGTKMSTGSAKQMSLKELQEAAEKIDQQCRLVITEGEKCQILQDYETRRVLSRLHLELQQPLPREIARHLIEHQCRECAFAIAFT